MDQEPQAGPDIVTPRRSLTVAVVAWMAGGVLLGYFYTALDEPLIPAGAFLWLVWIALGVVLAGLSAVGAARHRPSRRLGVAAAMFVLATIAGSRAFGPSLVRFGDRTRFRRQFARDLPLYRAIVADLERRKDAPSGQVVSQTIRYIVEPGPPLRVAFPLPGGILDNWEGVVYDPSDEVLIAGEIRPDLSNWNEPRFRAIRMWFGGELRYAERVTGHFYRCWFT
jgi:hypothetical protein